MLSKRVKFEKLQLTIYWTQVQIQRIQMAGPKRPQTPLPPIFFNKKEKKGKVRPLTSPQKNFKKSPHVP